MKRFSVTLEAEDVVEEVRFRVYMELQGICVADSQSLFIFLNGCFGIGAAVLQPHTLEQLVCIVRMLA